jgi:hypothetical protein
VPPCCCTPATAPMLLLLSGRRAVKGAGRGCAAGGLPSSSAVAGCSSESALMDSTQPAASCAAELGFCWWCRPLWCGRLDMAGGLPDKTSGLCLEWALGCWTD